MVGTPAGDDVIVYEEADERFWVGVGLTRSERYLHIAVGSKISAVYVIYRCHCSPKGREVSTPV